MILVKVIEDVTMPVPGFERHAYMCSLCNETEQRFVFNKRSEERELFTGTPIEKDETAPGRASVVPPAISQNLVQTVKSLVRLVRAK